MSGGSTLAAQVARLPDATVLVVGDMMLDRYVYGAVDRISPEAPIPVLKIERELEMLGGAGNVVRNILSLGARCACLAVLGEDEPGRRVEQLLGQERRDRLNFLALTANARRTSLKTRYVGGTQQMLRVDHETVAPLDGSTRNALLRAFDGLLDGVTVVVLSDYGKGVLDDGVAADLIGRARAAGKTVIVDPKGTDYRRYRGAHLVTPNRKELKDATRQPVGSDDEIVAAARHLKAGCGIEAVLATRSQDGMTLVPAEGEPSHLPAEAREVFDVSGAGDTVVATLAAALAAGVELGAAAEIANVAAGIVVGKIGTAAVEAEDLVAALHHRDISGAEAKVCGLDAAVSQVQAWRGRGLKVGFTNGCFDLLHPGHVSLLGQAKAACDRLVVGLNSDASVRRLKGPTRPVQEEAARATVLAALGAVDRVVIFDEDTPLRLIEALRPDVLVKGADYTVDTVVGAPLVQGYGGKVVLAKLEDGFSTTATLARLGK